MTYAMRLVIALLSLALTLSPRSAPVAPADIRIELRRGAVTMKITWPRSATADLAAWTRELLR